MQPSQRAASIPVELTCYLPLERSVAAGGNGTIHEPPGFSIM